jgi:hypothetical protein
MELDLAAGLDGFPGLVGAAPTHLVNFFGTV